MQDVFGNQIEFGEQGKVEFYGVQMKPVLAAIAFFMCETMDPQEWLKHVWVSDGSTVGDFNLEDEEVVKISETLGVPAGQRDYLWEIAQRIHHKEK